MKEQQTQHLTDRLCRWARRLVWQLPEQPYPSEHPWSRHHGGKPVG